MLHPLSPGRRRLVAAGLVTASVAVVALVVALTHQGPAGGPAGGDTKPPVVLVPGYGGATDALEVLAAGLRDDGRFVRIVELGSASLGDLHEQADLIQDTVADVRHDTGATTVDLVAFSAGGVAARLWATEDGGAKVARRIVTLSSPHHGTDSDVISSKLGGGTCPVACQQLDAGSSLIRDLNRGDETPAGPDWVSIWTDDDDLLVPPTTARLDGALDFAIQSVCPDLTVAHLGLPANPVVVAMVRDELDDAEPSRPSRSVCRLAPTRTP
jgi:triacylglycerol esterase/lipase EstA (alpha/beta hydrolase family)